MIAELLLLGYLVGVGVGILEIRRRIRQHRTAFDDERRQRTNLGWVRLR
jgi:hypothetical protein